MTWNARFGIALVAAAGIALPAVSHADLLLKNHDRRAYDIAVRYNVATSIQNVPSGTYIVITEGANSVQLRDKDGNPLGDPVEVGDGDRLYVKGGKLRVKKEVAAEQ